MNLDKPASPPLTPSADAATLFMRELIDSVESLTAIAEKHGARTLADLMYLQSAILEGGFIDAYPAESAVQRIVGGLPSASLWSKYIKQEYMLSSPDVEPATGRADDAGSEANATVYPRVVVLCTDASGAPEFHTCAPECTPEQVESGEHYELAKENAEMNGFEGPMLAFDSRDPAADGLTKIAAWLRASPQSTAKDGPKAESDEGSTAVCQSTVTVTVLHDSEIGSMNLRSIALECDEGGWMGGKLAIQTSAPLTRQQLEVAAAELGGNADFFGSSAVATSDAQEDHVCPEIHELKVFIERNAALLEELAASVSDDVKSSDLWDERLDDYAASLKDQFAANAANGSSNDDSEQEDAMADVESWITDNISNGSTADRLAAVLWMNGEAGTRSVIGKVTEAVLGKERAVALASPNTPEPAKPPTELSEADGYWEGGRFHSLKSLSTPPTESLAPYCPGCGGPLDHPENGCVVATLFAILKSRDDVEPEAIQRLHEHCDVDMLWTELGPLLDRLAEGNHSPGAQSAPREKGPR